MRDKPSGEFVGEIIRPLYGRKVISVRDPNWIAQLNAPIIEAFVKDVTAPGRESASQPRTQAQAR